MMNAALSERSRHVLREIVNGYVSSVEPVGSRTISKKCGFKLSPASIRNVMADLEEMGYIRQVHSSSGRIPTDKGYRFYVDDLIDITLLSQEEIDEIEMSFNPEIKGIEYILECTSRVLSTISEYSGIVLLHKFHDTVFKYIKFVKVSPKRVLTVFTTASGLLENRVIDLDEDISQEKLDTIACCLSNEFTGLPLKEIRGRLIERMARDKEKYDYLLKKIFVDENINEVYVGGTSNIFDHPEFVSDIGKIRAIVKAFEEKKELVKVLDKCIDQEGVSIIIGVGGQVADMQCCSMVTHTYKKDDTVLGVLGLVGPKRMKYSKTIALVDYTARVVSSILSESAFPN